MIGPKGFSLVEMAIVLMIVGLLVGGLFAPLSGQIDAAKISETRKLLNVAQEAMIGFALSNGRLPCPAQRDLATGSPLAGVEAFNGSRCTCGGGGGQNIAESGVGAVPCTDQSITGTVPWATLGIDETDAWGRRFTYRVTSGVADAPPLGALATFTLAETGNLKINTSITSPAVIVSHGKNGLGAFLPDGGQMPAASGDEFENADNNVSFVNRDQAPDFDDLVVWISPNILKNRMVTAGKLP